MRKIYLLKFISLLWFLLLIGCQKKEHVLKYNETTNTIEVLNKNYSIIALYINTKDKEGVEKEKVGVEYKKQDAIYRVGFDTVFINKSLLEEKKVPYEISVLVKHINKEKSLNDKLDKYKLMTLSSKEMDKGETDFRELLK